MQHKLQITCTLLIALIGATISASANFSFYGHTLQFSTSQIPSNVILKPVNQQNLVLSLERLNKYIGADFIPKMKAYQDDFRLDDVGVVLLIQSASASITSNEDVGKLVEYELLTRLSYDVLLSYSHLGLDVFGNLSEHPAASIYIIQEGKRYTDLNFKDNTLAGTRRIFKSNELNVRKTITIQTQSTPKLNANLNKRVILWTYKDRYYRIDAINNLSLAQYLKDLPVLHLGKEYVQRPCSDEFETSVLAGLREHLSGLKGHNEKVNFLLAFVQGAFRYKTDQEQFGIEKYNYPEETLSSDYSDCEDRTLLLAFLCKRLLNFNSVGLYFEKDKHICLAVAIPGHSNYHTLKLDNVYYVVCEPTGLGYQLGETGLPLNRITEVIPFF